MYPIPITTVPAHLIRIGDLLMDYEDCDESAGTSGTYDEPALADLLRELRSLDLAPEGYQLGTRSDHDGCRLIAYDIESGHVIAD